MNECSRDNRLICVTSESSGELDVPSGVFLDDRKWWRNNELH